MKLRRRDTRGLCADLLKIRWRTEQGVLRREYAALEDISPRGACLQLEEGLPMGTVVTILYPSGQYQGRVKYCDFKETGYFIGVEFDPGYEWSREQYAPAHLLQLPSGHDGI